jgi:hypothetical protein
MQHKVWAKFQSENCKFNCPPYLSIALGCAFPALRRFVAAHSSRVAAHPLFASPYVAFLALLSPWGGRAGLPRCAIFGRELPLILFRSARRNASGGGNLEKMAKRMPLRQPFAWQSQLSLFIAFRRHCCLYLLFCAFRPFWRNMS